MGITWELGSHLGWCLVSPWASLLPVRSCAPPSSVLSSFFSSSPKSKALVSSKHNTSSFWSCSSGRLCCLFCKSYLSGFGSHTFSYVLFVQLYHSSALAPLGLYIIYILHWTALQNASALLLLVLLAKLKLKKCSRAVGTLCQCYLQLLWQKAGSCLRDTAAPALAGLSQQKRKKIA